MVVGGGERDHLAQAELGQHAGVRRLEAGRVAERPDADDGALPRHEARHRLHGAQGARVGERHRRAGEIVGADLVRVDLADQVLVGQDERAEVERVGLLDARHEQRAAAVALLLVDGQAQPHVLVVDDARLARPVGIRDERGVQRRHVVQRAHDGVTDDVGEADLGAGRAGQLVVEDEAVHLEEAGRHRPHAGRRGHRQAGLHVGHDPRGGAPQDGGVLVTRLTDLQPEPGRRRRPAGTARLGRCLGLHGGHRGGHGGRPVVGEELPPAVADRVGIGQEAVVHVVDQPGIGAERASRAAELGHGPTLPAAVGSRGRPGSVCPAHEPIRPHSTSRCGRPPVPGAATVVFVHGSLDRGESFRRVMRRLPELAVVAYDRRGYQGSRGGGVVDLGGHIDDLLSIAEEARSGPGGPVVAVGHSLGGDVVVGAALASIPGPSTPSVPTSRPCPGSGSAALGPVRPGPGRRWPRIPPWRSSNSSPGWWARGRGPA